MKRILTIIAILGICSTTMAQNHLFDTITFFRGGRLYKLKLYPDRYVINDTTYYNPFINVGSEMIAQNDTTKHISIGSHTNTGGTNIKLNIEGGLFQKNGSISSGNYSVLISDGSQIQSFVNVKDYYGIGVDMQGDLFSIPGIGTGILSSAGEKVGFLDGSYGIISKHYFSSYSNSTPVCLGDPYSAWDTAFFNHITINSLSTESSPTYALTLNGGKYIQKATFPDVSHGNTAFGWGNWASGTLYPKRADSNAWTPYGYATPKSVYDGFVEWSHNFINVNDSTAKWGYAPWWGTNQALLGKEPSISKSTGFLKWTGSAWSWDNSTYVTTSDSRLSDSRAASDVYAWAKAATPPVVTSLSAGTYTITATYANTAGTANGLASGSYTVTVSNANSAGTCTGNAATVSNGVYKTDIDIIAWIGIDTTNISTTPTYFIKYSQGYIIDSIIYSVVRNAGSPDVTVKLWYGSNINSAGTALVTAGNQITSYAGQTKTGTINNATIAAGNVIWATFSAVAVKPKSIFITLKGHKI